MKMVVKSTEVRKEWSKFIDEVKWVKPALVKRNRDLIAVLSSDLLKFILKEYKMNGISINYEGKMCFWLSYKTK